MDPIKESFKKIKLDIYTLNKEIEYLKKIFNETNIKIIEISRILTKIYVSRNKTNSSLMKTSHSLSTTNNLPFRPLNGLIKGISTGNEGVSTDRQTDRQTDITKEKIGISLKNDVDSVAEILNSLDYLKRDIKIKFKKLTEQEMTVFALIYQLEEEEGYSSYKNLSERLKLTESSIRDYVQRLISKGIPLLKTKVKNKEVRITISPNLRKIASLETILNLRSS